MCKVKGHDVRCKWRWWIYRKEVKKKIENIENLIFVIVTSRGVYVKYGFFSFSSEWKISSYFPFLPIFQKRTFELLLPSYVFRKSRGFAFVYLPVSHLLWTQLRKEYLIFNIYTFCFCFSSFRFTMNLSFSSSRSIETKFTFNSRFSLYPMLLKKNFNKKMKQKKNVFATPFSIHLPSPEVNLVKCCWSVQDVKTKTSVYMKRNRTSEKKLK